MIFKKGTILLPAFLSFLCLSIGCEKNGQECMEPTSVLARVSFITKNKILVDSLIDSILVSVPSFRYGDTTFKSPVAYTIQKAQNVIVYGNIQNSFIGLPLDPEIKQIHYVLQYDTLNPLTDTISYFYDSKVHFLSNACGYTYYYHLNKLEYTQHVLDSAVIKLPEVTKKASDRQVELYFFNY